MYSLNWHRSFDVCKLVDAFDARRRDRCECFLSLTLVWLDWTRRRSRRARSERAFTLRYVFNSHLLKTHFFMPRLHLIHVARIQVVSTCIPCRRLHVSCKANSAFHPHGVNKWVVSFISWCYNCSFSRGVPWRTTGKCRCGVIGR